MATEPDVPQLIEAGLEELGLVPPLGVAAKLAELSALVAAWGARMNLSGHRSAEDVARRLVLDAAAVSAALPPDLASIADLGSGAGFPGLPLAILRPEARVVLVEARERRHHFQRHAARALGLPNVEPLQGRFESLPRRASALVVAQAVGPAAEVAAHMLEWALDGGLIAIPGGVSATIMQIAGAESARLQAYQVPLGGPERRIWTARKA